jgi:Ca2+-transporting ATPase
MANRVRPKGDPIVDRARWIEISGFALTMAISVLGSLLIAMRMLDLPSESAVTISFLTLALTQLWHVFSMRPRGARLFRNEVTRNPFVWAALALCVGLLLIAVYIPALSSVLDLEAPDLAGWSVAVGMSLLPFLVGLIRDTIRRVRSRHESR